MVYCCTGDGDGQNLDMSERVRQLNSELLNDPLPADVENRTTLIKFKDTLVDFISPTPEPESDPGVYYGFSETVETFGEVIPETPRDSTTTVENQPSSGNIIIGTTSVLENQKTLNVPTTSVVEHKSELQQPNTMHVKLSDAERERCESSQLELTSHDVSSSIHSDCESSESSIQKSSSTEAGIVQENSSNTELMSSTSQSSSVSQEDTCNEVYNSYSTHVSSHNGSKTGTEVVDADESLLLDNVTLVEQNGKFRIVTGDELKAVKSRRSQSATTPHQGEKLLLHPRPPSTPRAPVTERGYYRQQRSISTRRTMSARVSGSPAPLIKHNSPEIKSSQVKEEDERKRKKRDEANAAFRTWLRQKRVEAEARRNRSSVHGRTTNDVCELFRFYSFSCCV